MNKPSKRNVADLIHEIRNRLTYIMLSSNALYLDLQKSLSEKQQKEFSNIDIAAETIRALMDELDALLLPGLVSDEALVHIVLTRS